MDDALLENPVTGVPWNRGDVEAVVIEAVLPGELGSRRLVRTPGPVAPAMGHRRLAKDL